MFGLEGSGFIVAIAVTLLLAGAIVYYCNTRITAMEKAIVKQNQVLADFIGNVKNSLTNGSLAGGATPQPAPSYTQSQVIANGATQEAVDAANDYYSNTTPEKKIEVSDDSASEDDSDSDEESSSESESDSEEESENGELNLTKTEGVLDLTNANPITELSDNLEDIGSTVQLEVIGIQLTPPEGPPPPNHGPEITELTDLDEVVALQKDVKTIKLGEIKNEEELELATQESTELSSVESEDEQQLDNSSGTIDDGSTVNSQAMANLTPDVVMKLKVAKLRELAVTMNLGTDDAVKKINKAALQDMIKNKITETEE